MNMMSKEILTDLVKAAGQEIIDKAEGIVPLDCEFVTDMDIWISFRNNEPPSIECSVTRASSNSYPVIMKYIEKDMLRKD